MARKFSGFTDESIVFADDITCGPLADTVASVRFTSAITSSSDPRDSRSTLIFPITVILP